MMNIHPSVGNRIMLISIFFSKVKASDSFPINMYKYLSKESAAFN